MTTEKSHQLLKNLKFCVFDLETTGGNHEKDQIIEIGLVKVENLEVVAEKDFLVKPDVKVPEFIQTLTKIKPQDLEHAPKIEEILDEILEFMGDDILVAHNTSFDIPFFNSVLKRLGREELTNRVVCTNLMTKYMIPSLMNSNLSYMSELFQISHDQAHRAIEDAKAAANLLLKYLDIFIHKGIKKVNQIYYPKNKFELDRKHFQVSEFQQIRESLTGLPWPFLISLKGEKGRLLATCPFQKDLRDFTQLDKIVESTEWISGTVIIFGSYIETLLYYNTHYNKVTPEVTEMVMSYLDEQAPEKDDETFKLFYENDFLISNHLVQNQLICFPLNNLHYKTQLIFRFPEHKRKLLQYLSSHMRRNGKKSKDKTKKKSLVPKELLEIILRHLQAPAEQEQFLLVQGDKVQKQQKNFISELSRIDKSLKTGVKFPHQHI